MMEGLLRRFRKAAWAPMNSARDRHRPRIVFFNRFFDSSPDLSRLDAEDQAAFSSDRSGFETSDAVVFHIPSLFTARFGRKEMDALHKPNGQLWVAWSMESAVNYPVLDDPTFMRRFDLVMSYRRDSEIHTPYCPPLAEWRAALGEALPAKTEDAPVVMFRSAAPNKSARTEFALAIMSRIRVDSYGRFLNNRQLAGADDGRATRLATIKRYRFCLCLENAIEVDYVTEKFFDPFLAGTVPVYRGAPNIDQFAPGENAFINANDFSGPGELCTYLAELDRDEQAYRRYLQWRQEPLLPEFEANLEAQRRDPFAKLLDMVRARRARP